MLLIGYIVSVEWRYARFRKGLAGRARGKRAPPRRPGAQQLHHGFTYVGWEWRTPTRERAHNTSIRSSCLPVAPFIAACSNAVPPRPKNATAAMILLLPPTLPDGTVFRWHYALIIVGYGIDSRPHSGPIARSGLSPARYASDGRIPGSAFSPAWSRLSDSDRGVHLIFSGDFKSRGSR
jgi:hypothetical protein